MKVGRIVCAPRKCTMRPQWPAWFLPMLFLVSAIPSAHALGSYFHLPHGLANAIMLSYVIEFNATDTPTKQGMLPQYKYPWVKGRYARIADMLHLADDIQGDNPEDRAEKTARLARAIEGLKRDLEDPSFTPGCRNRGSRFPAQAG